MAGLTQVAGERMSGAFVSSGTDPVMTTGTVAGLPCHCAVIKDDTQPGGGAVAHIAGRRRCNVRGPLAGGNDAVMTVFTGVRGLSVIKG